MVRLFGRDFTRKELQAYIGHPLQCGGIRPIELAGGRERGVRGFDVFTGTGFEFTVLADRAMDITRAMFRGRALSYLSPAGQAHPAFYEASGSGWLHTFPGGLLTTCGLAHMGAACTDEGEALGLHGRVSTLPMEEVGFWTAWEGDELWMRIRGTLTEGVLFGNPLRLTRQISARLGGNSLYIDDIVENLGGQPTPHMMLYHCNLGFPILGPEARFVSNSADVQPRDAEASRGLAQYAEFQPPTPGYAEQVFYHTMAADNAGDVRVALINPALDGGLGIYVRYHQATLSRFIQWKSMAYGSYVLGMEPANAHVEGRAKERTHGALPVLQPGESRTYRVEIGVLDGLEEIEACERAIKLGGAP